MILCGLLAFAVLAVAQSVTVITIPSTTATNVNNTVQVTTNDVRFKTLVAVGETGPGTNNAALAYLQFSFGGTNTVSGIPFGGPGMTNLLLKLEFGPLGYSASNLFIRFKNTNDGASIFLLP